MSSHVRAFVCFAMLTPAFASAASLYLCKSYGGGTFWSSGHCSTQKATIERIVTVPDDMPFDQQVQLGNQVVSEAARLNAPPPQQQGFSQGAQRAQPHDECRALDEPIRQLDSMARQPQSGASQDWIAEKRRVARDRQFRLRCR